MTQPLTTREGRLPHGQVTEPNGVVSVDEVSLVVVGVVRLHGGSETV